MHRFKGLNDVHRSSPHFLWNKTSPNVPFGNTSDDRPIILSPRACFACPLQILCCVTENRLCSGRFSNTPEAPKPRPQRTRVHIDPSLRSIAVSITVCQGQRPRFGNYLLPTWICWRHESGPRELSTTSVPICLSYQVRPILIHACYSDLHPSSPLAHQAYRTLLCPATRYSYLPILSLSSPAGAPQQSATSHYTQRAEFTLRPCEYLSTSAWMLH